MLKCSISCSLLILICNASVYSQSVDKNEYVRYEITSSDEHYEINYRFKDPFQNFQNYTLSLPKSESDRMIRIFGVPRWLFNPYPDNETNRELRDVAIRKGLFKLNGNVIEVDKNAVIAYYGEIFARPIAKMIVSSLSDYGLDTRRNRIEFTMRFIQDIPYGIPLSQDQERHYGGVHVPPQLLIKGYGDCDSKALLFVSILSHLIPTEDILFLNQTDHVLTAVKDNIDPGLTYIRYDGLKYLIAETSGPGKRMLGQPGGYFSNEFTPERVSITPPEILALSDNKQVSSHTSYHQQIDNNILVLTNESSRNFHFQISRDKRNWEALDLEANQTGRYIYRKQTSVYLRLTLNGHKTLTYRIDTGNSYLVYWNGKRKRWELSTS